MKATFDEESFTFSIDGAEVDLLTAKGASASIAREAQANLSLLGQQLSDAVIRNGGIANSTAELQQFYEAVKRETKLLHMAEFALSRGGVDQVSDWERAEKIIAEQWSGNEDFPGLRKFVEDIQAGRYGTSELSQGVLSRTISYASAGRATYENERLAAQIEKGGMESARIMGGVEKHCDDCPAWAALGYIPSQEMYDNYAIGTSQCNVNCYCVIVTRRKRSDS